MIVAVDRLLRKTLLGLHFVRILSRCYTDQSPVCHSQMKCHGLQVALLCCFYKIAGPQAAA
jgi:hypothetical protein